MTTNQKPGNSAGPWSQIMARFKISRLFDELEFSSELEDRCRVTAKPSELIVIVKVLASKNYLSESEKKYQQSM